MNRLTPQRYIWRLYIDTIVVKNDQHWEYVDGSNERPETELEAVAWDKRDKKAKADLSLAMSPLELGHVKHCTTSKEVWQKLDLVYKSKGPARKATLLKQLLFTKMGDGDSMPDHLNKFFSTIDPLTELDIMVSDDLLTILLLYSVPNSIDNFRCAIEARDELPTFEALKIKLLKEFSARKGKDTEKIL